MRVDRGVKTVSPPAVKPSGFTGAHPDVKKQKDVYNAKPTRNNRRVLEELQQEAKELLSLTYGLNLDNSQGETKPLLETPKLHFKDATKEAINDGWFGESPQKVCHLKANQRSVAVGTEPILKVKNIGQNSTAANMHTIDVLSPVHQLEKPLAYPLDLAINDFSTNAPLVANATRESYREMLVALQQKYTVIMRMFEEINEQRMSYIEGLRETQGHLDNARSVMQLQKVEITKLRAILTSRECTLEGVRDELNHFKELLEEHVRHETELEDALQDKQERLNCMAAENSNLNRRIGDLADSLEKMSFMPTVNGIPEFQDMKFTYRDALRELEEFMTALFSKDLTEEELNNMVEEKKKLTGPLRYMEAVIDIPITDTLVEYYRKRFALEEQYNKKLAIMREEQEREIQRNREMTQQLVDTYAARIHQANADSLNAKNLLEAYARRAACKSASSVEKSKMNEKILKQLSVCINVYLLDKTMMGKEVFKDISFRVINKVCQLGREKGKEIVPKHEFHVKDIQRLDFGIMSSAYILHRNASKSVELLPWQFFTITTNQREYHMGCPNDNLLDVVIIGLNRMMLSTGFMVGALEISRMRIMRAKMRLHHYCVTNNISHKRMWLNAIDKTVAERKAGKKK